MDKVLATLSPYWTMPKELTCPWPPRTNYYEHYALWAGLIKPDTILEIGAMFGWSVMAMLAGWPHVKEVVLIDSEMYRIPVTEARRRIFDFCSRENILPPTIAAIKANSNKLKSLPAGFFDLMHVDGEHTPDAVYHDLVLCSRQLSRKGVIIVDDLKLPGIKGGADRFLNENGEFVGRVVPTHQDHYLIWRKLDG